MARKPSRRQVMVGLLVVSAIGMGCSPLLAPFQMLGLLNNPKTPCQFDFYERARTAKKKRDIKVVVLSYPGRGLAPDYMLLERELSNQFARKLDEAFKTNKEHVTVVPMAEMTKFKREHENWRGMKISEVGKHFGADYVIDMELAQLSLYEPGTRDIFRGHCRIPITVVDVDKDDDDAFAKDEYSIDYPSGGVPIQVGSDMTVERFQIDFMTKVAIDLTGKFTSMPSSAGRLR